MFIAPNPLKGLLRAKERTNLDLAVRQCLCSFERSRRSGVTASYKHAAAPGQSSLDSFYTSSVNVPYVPGSERSSSVKCERSASE